MAESSSSSDSRIPVWLDCDPGHDKKQDAFAILLAAHSPQINLLGISTVHGNASLDSTTTNAGAILTAIGRPEVPVYPGAPKPFCREGIYAPDIHGATGVDGTDLLPAPSSPPMTDINAVLAMRKALLSQPSRKPWLVATGTLTNVALLFATFPELAEHVKGLSIMGGAIGGGFTPVSMTADNKGFGNTTFYAEFNIYCDPEAAQSIFSNPVLAAKTTLAPLDLTHQVIATKEVRQRILEGSPGLSQSSGLTVRQMFHDLLSFYVKTYEEIFGLKTGSPVHDPVSVAVILFDEGMEELEYDDRGGERWDISVVTEGTHEPIDYRKGRDPNKAQLGRTIAKQAAAGQGGVRIPRGVNAGRFWDVVEDCVQRSEEKLLAQQHQSTKR
ncbi:MAG: hypothetical protein Q9191_007427 [Dirinaria sp. TL-2023a]